MKEETTGKRFTRQTTTTSEPEDLTDYEAVVEVFSMMKGGLTFDKALSHSKKAAEAILTVRNLPTTIYIHQQLRADKTIKETFTDDKPKLSANEGFDVLPDYLISKYNLDQDSFEVLAGEILHLVHCIESNSKENAKGYLDIFKLGQTTEALRVRLLDSHFHAVKGGGDKNPLSSIIKQLAKKEGSAEELWSELETILINKRWHPNVIDINGKPHIEHECAKKPYSFKAFSNRISYFRNKK